MGESGVRTTSIPYSKKCVLVLTEWKISAGIYILPSAFSRIDRPTGGVSSKFSWGAGVVDGEGVSMKDARSGLVGMEGSLRDISF